MTTPLKQNSPTVVVGMDDLAEGDRNVLGFTALTVDREQLPRLERAAHSILNRSGLSEFHGSEFAPQYEAFYDLFLAAVVEAMESSRHGCALVRYQSANRFHDNLKFGEELLTNTLLPKLSKPNVRLVNALSECSGWIALLAHNWRDIAPGVPTTEVEMDSDSSKEALKTETVVEGALRDGQWAVMTWHNALCSVLAKKGLTTCRLARFRIADSRDSVIVQAADVLGNFSLSHLLLVLGCKAGASATKKIDLLKKHFSPELPDSISGWTCRGGNLSPGTIAQDFVLRVSTE